jgi:hypothetical protein
MRLAYSPFALAPTVGHHPLPRQTFTGAATSTLALSTVNTIPQDMSCCSPAQTLKSFVRSLVSFIGVGVSVDSGWGWGVGDNASPCVPSHLRTNELTSVFGLSVLVRSQRHRNAARLTSLQTIEHKTLPERRELCNILQTCMLDLLVSTYVCSWVFDVLDRLLPRLIPKGNFVRGRIKIYVIAFCPS